MKIEQKTPLLTLITSILFGIFVTSAIFAITLQALGKTGLYLGLILTASLIFLGFYKAKPRTAFRFITWGMLFTLIVGIIGYFVGLSILKGMLEGF
ncbi:MAG: hypothetical protein V1679_01725 [Candidatus Peregrinibacteria bacterium]